MTNDIAQQIDQLIRNQQNYFDSSVTKPLAFRKEQLRKLKTAISKYEKDIQQALYDDLRKSDFESYATEIGIVYASISHALKYLEEWMHPVSVPTPVQFQPGKSMIVHDPYGVTLIIGPFNYPFQLVMEPLIGAIIGGNTAVVKPSESSVHTSAIVKKIIEETFHRDYLAVIEGEKEETNALIHAPFDYIFFTGSVAVGKIVAKAAANRLTPHTLELGGKSPVIVDQTANLEIAAKRILWGKFVNAGQTCIAPDYIVVHESVRVAFIRQIKKILVKFYGKDAQKSPDFGRIINKRQFDRLASLLQQQQQQILFGGMTDQDDLYIEPTVLQDVLWEHPIMQDEIFGPILPILTYSDLGQVITQIKKKPKPLAAYFFSETEKAIQYFLDELPFGGGCINETITHVGSLHLPFGGVGESGVGNYHGKASFDTFTHQKSILKRSSKLATNLLYPPYKQKKTLVKTILR
ncbi:aldehyde dehydrogenase [Kurthia sibirica]|uniref:Aldehyde dehydrogenase n=1 Tax=Kurthia sibirica TaxID=202750 RepID=A0A2U3AMV6_9BACL|nr:aldehyde dehydrogenase [Kurthia sibirica]PWI25880.1 aldehyde dehydrogenase [Kurthia sibirica]GEK34320.1 aldehyde dehydrogenase [Kurthia sibirica]